MKAITAVWKWLDGKKTWTGAILATAPQLVNDIAKILHDGGADPSAFTKVAGYALFVLGAAHKLHKGQ